MSVFKNVGVFQIEVVFLKLKQKRIGGEVLNLSDETDEIIFIWICNTKIYWRFNNRVGYIMEKMIAGEILYK